MEQFKITVHNGGYCVLDADDIQQALFAFLEKYDQYTALDIVRIQKFYPED